VRNLTVKLVVIRFSVKVWMGKLEFTASLILIAALTVSSAASAEEEYYTWVDENGITNYAERNPSGYEARFVTREQQRFGYRTKENKPEAPGAEDAQGTAGATADANSDIDAEIAEEKNRIDQEIAAAKKSNCNIGKLNLAQLSNYNRIKVKDDEGEVRILSDEEKQGRIDRAQATIAENCGG
jgi:hypothetical protein